MALPLGKRALPAVLEVAPDRGRRLSDAALVEASVAARLLGMRILTLNATVALVPAEVTVATGAVQDRAWREEGAAPLPREPSESSRGRSRSAGYRLSDAVRNLDEGAKLLAEAQRNGA